MGYICVAVNRGGKPWPLTAVHAHNYCRPFVDRDSLVARSTDERAEKRNE